MPGENIHLFIIVDLFRVDAEGISKVTYADGSVVSYIRDAAGNVTSQTDNTGTTTFTYDGDNRLLTKTIPGGVTITMAYGQSGNLTSYTDQGGTVTYSYNNANLLTTLTEPGGANTTFSYDANNRRTGVTYPNGVTMSLTYDKAGRETGVTASHAGTTLSGYTYKYGGGTPSVDVRTSMTKCDPINAVDPSGRASIGVELGKACIEGAVGGVASLIIAAIIASAIALPFVPITIAALFAAAAGGCLVGVIVQVTTIVLNAIAS